MERENWFLALLVVGLVFLIVWQPQAGWGLQGFLFGGGAAAPSENEKLSAENLRLKTELDVFQSIKNQLPDETANAEEALVYSRYPFNFKNELLINIGFSEGILFGQAVIFDGFLVGEIGEVFDDASLVRTIFDRRWQSAVRIGKEGIEALLVGGNRPKLTLIDKKARIVAGDTVYSAAPNFPAGIPIAEVQAIEFSSDQLFQEATLRFSYEITGIRAVSVVKKNVIPKQ